MRVTDAKPFPDLEAGLVEWAATTVPGLISTDSRVRYKHVGDELPSEYAKRLPFAEVEVRGGPTDGLSWYAEVGVHMFASSRAEAGRVLRDMFARMDVYPRHFGGVVVDSVEVTVYPSRSKNQEPDEDTTCFYGEMQISLRR